MISLEYALAIHSLGEDNDLADVFKEEFEVMLKLFKNEETESFFASYNIEKNVKKDLIKKFNFSILFTNFLCLLIDKNRFNLLKEIYNEYLKIDEEKNKIIKFTIYSPNKLEEKQLTKLWQLLNAKYPSNKIKLINKIDHNLIGGLKIYKEDEILDLSIVGQLDDLKILLERR